MEQSSNGFHVILDDDTESQRNVKPKYRPPNNFHSNSSSMFHESLCNVSVEQEKDMESLTFRNIIHKKNILVNRFLKYRMKLVQTSTEILDQESYLIREKLESIQINKHQHTSRTSLSDCKPSLATNNRHFMKMRTRPNREIKISDTNQPMVFPRYDGITESSPYSQKEINSNLLFNHSERIGNDSTLPCVAGMKRKHEDLCNKKTLCSSINNETIPNPTIFKSGLQDLQQREVAQNVDNGTFECDQIGYDIYQSDQEKDKLLIRLERMRRMAKFLNHMDRLQQSFLKEVLICFGDINDQENDYKT